MSNLARKMLALCISLAVLTVAVLPVYAAYEYTDSGKDVLKKYTYEDGEMGFINQPVTSVISSDDLLYGKILKAESKDTTTSGTTFSEYLPIPEGTNLFSFDIKVVSDTANLDFRMLDTNNKRLKMISDNGDKTLRLDAGNTGRGVYTVGKWHTVDILLDATNAKMYLDGELKSECAHGLDVTTLEYVLLGVVNVDLSSGNEAAVYHIDNLTLSNTAKTSNYYGAASKLDEKRVVLTLSETIAGENKEVFAAKTKLYNEETGEEIALDGVEVRGKNVILTAAAEIASGRYVVTIPEGCSSILQKSCYTDKFYFSVDKTEDISEVNFESEGAVCGPMSEVSPKSITVKAKLTKEIDPTAIPDDAIVAKGKNNSDNISAVEYSYAEGVLSATIKNLAPSAAYTLEIKGLKGTDGTALSDYVTTFKTQTVADYGSGFTSMQITKDGTIYKFGGVYKNQRRYSRNFSTLIVEYNNNMLVQVDIVKHEVPEWTPAYTMVEATLENVKEDSVVRGFIWENFTKIKPFEGTTAVDYSNAE